MTETIDGFPDNAVERSPEVEEFRRRIAEADGTLIHLKKPSKQGHPLSVSAQFYQYPDDTPWWFIEDEEKRLERIEKRKAKYSPDDEYWEWIDADPINSILIVHAFAQVEKELYPIGHADWYRRGNVGNITAGFSDRVIPKNELGKKATDFWMRNTTSAVKVFPEYQRMGLGSLLIASGALGLAQKGIPTIKAGTLTEAGEAQFKKFGMKEVEKYPIEQITQNPYTDLVIASFVQ